MKVEFFPAAETELLEAAKEYEVLFSGLGSDFLLRSSGSLLRSSSCPRSARSSIQYTAGFRCAAFHMHSSSAATVMSSVSSRWRIEDADRGTGSLVFRIANELFELTCETHPAQQWRWA